MMLDIDSELSKVLDSCPVYPFYHRVKLKERIEEERVEIIRDCSPKDYVLVSIGIDDVNRVVIKNGLGDYNYEIIDSLDSMEQSDCHKTMLLISYVGHFECARKNIEYVFDRMDIDEDVISSIMMDECLFTSDPYGVINKLRKNINQGSSDNDSYIKLIYNYIWIRDFVNALSFIDLYVQKRMHFYSEIEILGEGLREFLEMINIEMGRVDPESLVLIWVDSIQYDVLEEMSFLRAEKDRSLCFENAYTITPYTVATYFTIFCKKMCVKDDYSSYKHDIITSNNSNVMKNLSERGYFFTRNGAALNIFENENCSFAMTENEAGFVGAHLENKPKRQYKEYDFNEDICPTVLWKTLKDVLMIPRAFSVCHIDPETHTPYVCGNYDGDYVNDQFKPNEHQVNYARDYVDQQLEFYLNLFRENVRIIVMSDHGKFEIGKNGRKYEDKYHSILLCYGNGIPKHRVSGMFSYYHFSELIKYVTNPDEDHLKKLFSDYVYVEDLDRYSSQFLNQISDDNTILWKDSLLGYKGVRDSEGMLIRRNDGKESYFRYPCPIDFFGISFEDHISRLRSLLPVYEQDLSRPYYSFSKVIRKAIDYHNRNSEANQQVAREVIEDLFGTLVGRRIALRGELKSVYPLLGLLKRKDVVVKYVIDNGLVASYKVNGIEFCNLEMADFSEIDDVVVSSFRFRSEIIEEIGVDIRINDTKVVDIYSELEKNGIFLDEQFGADYLTVRDFRIVMEDVE